MRKHALLVGLLALSLGSLGGCMCGHKHESSMKQEHEEKEAKESKETEVKITVDQLPAPVKTTMDKEAMGGPISDVEKETEDGKTSYEAHTTISGSPYVMKVAEDGTLKVLKLKTAKKEGEEKEGKDDDDKDEKGEK